MGHRVIFSLHSYHSLLYFTCVTMCSLLYCIFFVHTLCSSCCQSGQYTLEHFVIVVVYIVCSTLQYTYHPGGGILHTIILVNLGLNLPFRVVVHILYLKLKIYNHINHKTNMYVVVRYTI